MAGFPPFTHLVDFCFDVNAHLKPEILELTKTMDIDKMMEVLITACSHRRPEIRRHAFSSFSTLAVRVGLEKILKNEVAIDTFVGYLRNPDLDLRFQSISTLLYLHKDCPEETRVFDTNKLVNARSILPDALQKALFEHPDSQIKTTLECMSEWRKTAREAIQKGSLKGVGGVAARIIQSVELGIVEGGFQSANSNGQIADFCCDGWQVHYFSDMLSAASNE
ncbi:hypothetical protein HK102_013521 [Quaeritorhiza haematococci]|nr:hypothetical protein HK102_013521 [Quaeritorhiza haematococci]